MYLNLEKNYRPAEVKAVFEKYLIETGVANDVEFYHNTQQVESDIKFFNEFMKRSGSTSSLRYEARLSESGLIYNDFLQKINARFNYYDFNLLLDYLYMYEVLKRIYKIYWVQNTGINAETVIKAKEFHIVVEYYMDMNKVEDYCHCFIGSSYGIGEFLKMLHKVPTPERSVATESK